MNTPFIRNHQYNVIRKLSGQLQHTVNTVSDPRVVEAVRHSAAAKVAEAFPDATEAQREWLGRISELRTEPEFHLYLSALKPALTEFPRVTDNQLKKLFPKNKKLKLPELAELDYRYITYLGWTDIATNKLFLVYPLNGTLVGIEGRVTPLHQKSVCFACNRHEQVALFSVVTKTRPAGVSPDYYKAIGNYLCVDSVACNKNMTDVSALEKFITNAL